MEALLLAVEVAVVQVVEDSTGSPAICRPLAFPDSRMYLSETVRADSPGGRDLVLRVQALGASDMRPSAACSTPTSPTSTTPPSAPTPTTPSADESRWAKTPRIGPTALTTCRYGEEADASDHLVHRDTHYRSGAVGSAAGRETVGVRDRSDGRDRRTHLVPHRETAAGAHVGRHRLLAPAGPGRSTARLRGPAGSVATRSNRSAGKAPMRQEAKTARASTPTMMSRSVRSRELVSGSERRLRRLPGRCRPFLPATGRPDSRWRGGSRAG